MNKQIRGWKKRESKPNKTGLNHIIIWFNPADEYAVRLSKGQDFEVSWGSYEHKTLDEDIWSESKKFPSEESALKFSYDFMEKINNRKW